MPTNCSATAAETEALDVEFKEYHFTIIDLTESELNLDSKQVVLDDHDDRTAELTHHICQLASPVEHSMKVMMNQQRHLRKYQVYIEWKLR